MNEWPVLNSSCHYLSTVRPTDQETTALNRVCYSQLPRRECAPSNGGQEGPPRGWPGYRGSRGGSGLRPLWWFLQEELGIAE